MQERSPLEHLQAEPEAFTFDAAVRLLLGISATGAADDTLHGDKLHDNKIAFVTNPSLAQPGVEVTSAAAGERRKRARLVTTMFGLIGPSGVLPRWYTELLAQAARNKSLAIVDFFDLLAQRFAVAFARAGIKYRLHRSAETIALTRQQSEPVADALLALTGYGTANLVDRLACGADTLRHYSGFFAARPRSADRLASMVSDYLGRKVEIDEFAGAWLPVPPDQQSRMPRGRRPGAYNRLGVDCAIGTRAWDQQARFLLRIGPLTHDEFEELLPDKPRLKQLAALVRAYAGWEADFAVNLVLDAAAIPPLRMAGRDNPAAPRLGWTSWMPSDTRGMRGQKTAGEALFSATLIESLPN